MQVPKRCYESFKVAPVARVPQQQTISSLLTTMKVNIQSSNTAGETYNTKGTTRINFYQGGGGYSIPYLEGWRAF